jgi:hypothetical protein
MRDSNFQPSRSVIGTLCTNFAHPSIFKKENIKLKRGKLLAKFSSFLVGDERLELPASWV